ncbi:MAG: cytochrome c [Thiobacillus sp.]|nr:cytochrome c [Thiobacillus sp.]
MAVLLTSGFPMTKKMLSLSVLVLALLLTGCGAVEDTRPGQPVKTRQEAFKSLLRSFEPMSKMMKEDRYDADKFVQMAADFMVKRNAPWSHFGPDTNYPPSKANSEVWQDAAAFERAKQDFFAASDALNAAAQARDKTRVENLYSRVYDTCKSCHDSFRHR